MEEVLHQLNPVLICCINILSCFHVVSCLSTGPGYLPTMPLQLDEILLDAGSAALGYAEQPMLPQALDLCGTRGCCCDCCLGLDIG